MNKVLFSSLTTHWTTPVAVYNQLHEEFNFTLDPCPLYSLVDDKDRSWVGERVFCNPPYGPGISKFLVKARDADCAVYLLPSRTDTRWFHDYCLAADEIRFIKGRLKFGESKNSAPFPSIVVIFNKQEICNEARY